jgi:hypothetical protein
VPLPGTGLLPEPIFGAGTAPSAVSPLVAALESALPRALRIGPEEVPSTAEGEPGVGIGPRDAFSWTMAMLSRIDHAAVYVGLLTRARAPIDSPDGLGRPGRSVAHLPSTGGRPAWGNGREPWDAGRRDEGESGSWS